MVRRFVTPQSSCRYALYCLIGVSLPEKPPLMLIAVTGEFGVLFSIVYWPVVPVVKSPPRVGSSTKLMPAFQSFRLPPSCEDQEKSSLNCVFFCLVVCGVFGF